MAAVSVPYLTSDGGDAPAGDESAAGRSACPPRRLSVSGREVVEDDDVLAALDQRLDCMTADVAGAAGDEDRAHGRPIE